MKQNDITSLIEILHEEKCSCVISTDGKIIICHERGVKDLYKILNQTPELLEDALIADKVIGKGAAALMILGKVKEVYADIISRPALDLFASSGISISYGSCVPNIINRSATGICPVEALCKEAQTAEECFSLISGFIRTKDQNTNNKIETLK